MHSLCAQVVLLGSKMGSIGDGRTGGGLVRIAPLVSCTLWLRASCLLLSCGSHKAPVRLSLGSAFGS